MAGGDHLIGVQKDALVLVQTGEQPVFARAAIHPVDLSQDDGMLLQLFAAEEFGAQQTLILVVMTRVRLTHGRSRPLEDYSPAPLIREHLQLLEYSPHGPAMEV